MLILLESPDNCGKTTQVQHLTTYFAQKNRVVNVVHYSNIKGLSSKECRTYSSRLYEDMFHYGDSVRNKVTICDRAHIGEFVYGPMYRNYSGKYVFDIEKKFVDRVIWRKNVYLIIFVDEPENLLAREDGLSQSKNDISKIALEKKRFEEAYELSHIHNKLLINIAGKDKEQVFTEIRKFIEK
jgi:thymidylate kinase